MHKVTLIGAMQAAGYGVQDSPNVIVATRGAHRVYATLAGRGWLLRNAWHYPTRHGKFRRPEQVTEFCRSLVEPVPVYFDGRESFRLEHVGGMA